MRSLNSRTRSTACEPAPACCFRPRQSQLRFSAQALADGGLGVATWLALASFVGLAVAALAILWPHRWEFTANPANVIESYIETAEPFSVAEIHRDLSLHMHASYAENLVGQKQLASRFRLAGVLLTAEVVLWLIDLASKA